MPDRRPPSHPPMPPAIGRGPESLLSSPISNTRPNGGFLPLSAEVTPLSTRNQHLTSLIHNRSYTALEDARRGSSFRTSWRPDDNAEESDLELGKSYTQSSIREESEQSVFGNDGHVPQPPPSFPLKRGISWYDREQRRVSIVPPALSTPHMRGQRLIGNSNPRYRWQKYYKTADELKKMKKPLRKYYERNNYLVQQYMYIDKLLDSSLPLTLIEEYNNDHHVDIPPTIPEGSVGGVKVNGSFKTADQPVANVKRTKDIYKVSNNESTPLLSKPNTPEDEDNDSDFGLPEMPEWSPDEDDDSSSRIVTVAIYVNLAANTTLLILKIIVTIMTDSLSVLASLVDAALDFLSTGIVWTTTYLISRAGNDIERYPVGRRRLEPIGVLVFSVIMITSFFQVALQSFSKLTGPDHKIVELSIPAVIIMATTVAVKFLCWLWCRLIKNSSVQALAQDAVTDMVFNTFSIIFPLCGYFLRIWWLDPLGGLLLSFYVIISWCSTSQVHILNLTGHAASKDERNILLYLTMRFAHTIRYIQGCTAYHAGDKLNVEVDIVLDESMSLRDSHDLGESLQYVLESVPGVERAFVHSDYRTENLPSHMRQ